MSANAIALITDAVRLRLEAAVGVGKVYVGPPVAEDVGDRKLALFLFHILPNQAMRNQIHYVPASIDPADPFVEANAIPLDLRYLVSAFRSTGTGNGGLADPDEMLNLGAAIQQLHAHPDIDSSQVPNQMARITPEPFTMEDLSRVWSLLPQTSYRTSVVYLVSPVFIALAPPVDSSRVTERGYQQGPLSAEPTLGGAPWRTEP
ncbi:Pvc16 family protein [Arthrobacter sp. Z4-13]